MSESEIIQALRTKIASNLHVAMPGVIESYEFKEQRATIKILVKQLYNSDTYIDYPILSGVPVIFLRSGGASITMPVVRGDTCLVMFLDKDLRAWLLGGDNLKPKSTRSHHLSDAVAIMGLSPFSVPSPAENNEDVLISFAGSKVRLKPKGIIDIETAKEVNIKTESIIINCKNAVVNSTEDTKVECRNAIIKATENASLNCKSANIEALEDINIKCNNGTIKATNTADIECATATIKASNSINTETPNFLQKGNMKVDGSIEVTGTSLLTGKLTSQNGIENSGANLISNGKTFETHTHIYQDVTAVTAPEGPCAVTKVPTNSQSPS